MIPANEPQNVFKFLQEILYLNTGILKVEKMYSICIESGKIKQQCTSLFVEVTGHHTNNFSKLSVRIFKNVLNCVIA